MEANIAQDSLSPYERYQLERFGNVLNNADPMEEFESTNNNQSTAEAAFIFNSENPTA